MTKTLALRGVWMTLGYGLAVLVATTVVCVVNGLPTVLPDQGRFGSFYRYWADFPMMFSFGLMMTAVYGLPGWLITVVSAEWRGRQGKYWFASAGMLTALLAIFIASRFQGLFYEWVLNGSILIGGFCGGLAYWALAGKSSGNWKSTSRVGS